MRRAAVSTPPRAPSPGISARFIPGQPNVVVQNMEGAAGIVSVNHLERRVAPDGLTLAMPGRSWYIEAIVKRPGITFDPVKLTYIGSPGAVSAAAFIRTSTGIKTFDELESVAEDLDLRRARRTTPTAMAPALLAANGAPIKVVLGYVSTARVLLALEQGEVDGSFTVGNALASRADCSARWRPSCSRGASRGACRICATSSARAIGRSSTSSWRRTVSACRWSAPPACRRM